MKRLLREPLVHFLLLGGALFLLYSLLGPHGDGGRPAIVVTSGQVDSLAAGFARTWQRPPTAQELNGLVQDHIRQEVYAREARALGLDRDDVVVNRRLRQKLEFVTEDVAAFAEPTEADLLAYLQAHPASFQTEARLWFTQVYLNPARHRDVTRQISAVHAQLERIGDSAEASALGDVTLLESRLEGVAVSDVATQFGESFAARLSTLPTGRWEGPIESPYGVHLVFVQQRQDGQLPGLETVRTAVAREWGNMRRQQANEAFYRGLLARYTVTVEAPRITGDGSGPNPGQAAAREQ